MPAWRGIAPSLVIVALAAFLLTLWGPAAWLILPTDGLYPLLLLVSAAGWGAWPARWLGVADGDRVKEALLAVALGLGWFAIAALALGVAGWMSGAAAWGLLIGGGVLGCAGSAARARGPCSPALGAAPAAARQEPRPPNPPRSPVAARQEPRPPTAAGDVVLRSLVLSPLAIPLAVGLFGACLPPGVLWAGEGGGYDVLEYHLQAPREYFEAGRIHFLPHNVYASFPQQVELLYYVLMHLCGGPHAAAIPAQLLHLMLGVLAVAAVAAWAPAGWPRIVAALLAGGAVWPAYGGALAYVENGLLFFAAVAGGIVLDAFRGVQTAARADDSAAGEARASSPGHTATARADSPCYTTPADSRCHTPLWTHALAAGLCAGLAAGCKYTAVALVALPLGLAWVALPAPLGRRIGAAAAFGAAALVAFSPWLSRNAAFTGNPVYPFAYDWFGGAAWSDEQAAQWARGHRLPAADDSAGGRTAIAIRELLGTPIATYPYFAASYFGPLAWLAALLGAWIARSRFAFVLLGWLAFMLAVWLLATHMPGRFLVPALVPLAWLAALGVEALHPGVVSKKDCNTEVATCGLEARTPHDAIPRTHCTGADVDSAMARPRPGRRATALLVALAFTSAVWNGLTLLRLRISHEERWAARTGEPLRAMLGQAELFVAAHPVNRLTPPGARVWIIGDAAAFYVDRPMHYTVAFNRDPWLTFSRSADLAAAVAWLRGQGVGYVLFSWPEIDRLGRTYGFDPRVTREWVRSLVDAGLRRLPLPPGEDLGGGELYEVPPK